MNLVIDSSNWKMRQYRDFIKATKDSDLDAIIKLVPQLISSWSLTGDPKDTEWVLDNVSLKEWIEITQAVNKSLTEEFNNPKK